MEKNQKMVLFYSIILSIILLVSIEVYAATTNDTTMTWVVASNKSHSIGYAGGCSSIAFFFVESTCSVDGGDTDGNGSKCLPQTTSAGGTACQDATTIPLTVTNNGNTAISVDGNFVVDFNGNDVNMVLKVWMSNGPGCGASGLGGWTEPCTVTGSNPVTSSTCRNYNQLNETATGSRLTTSLPVNDSNGLCFSGDFNGGMTGGSHPVTFRTTGD